MTAGQDIYGTYVHLPEVGTAKASLIGPGGTLSATFSSAAIDGRIAVGDAAYSFQRMDDRKMHGERRGFVDTAETPLQILAISDGDAGNKVVTVAPKGWKPLLPLPA